MDLIPANLFYVALIAGCIIQLGLALLYRKVMASVADLFFLNLLYISFGLSGLVVIYLGNGNERLLDEAALMLLWLFAMRLGYSSNLQSGLKSLSAAQSRPRDIAAMTVVLAVYGMYFLQILSSNIFSLAALGANVIDNRFIVQQENRLQGYLFTGAGVMPAVFLFRLFPNLRVGQFLLAIIPFWLVQASTFSKSGLLYPVFAGALYYSLRIKAGNVKRPGFAGQLIGLSIAASVIFAIYWGITTFLVNGDGDALNALLTRLFTSFDGLIMLSELTFKQEGTLSLLQWYFSPFLKVLGLFTQDYNSFNFLLANEYFGYSSDYSGMLPNNNHIGELIATFPPYARWLAALATGCLYGLAYRTALRQVVKSGHFLMPAAFIVATPLGFLVDGQGWMLALNCAVLLSFAAFALRKAFALLSFLIVRKSRSGLA